MVDDLLHMAVDVHMDVDIANGPIDRVVTIHVDDHLVPDDCYEVTGDRVIFTERFNEFLGSLNRNG